MRAMRHQRGLSLIELMIAIAVGLFVMAGVFAMFQVNIRTYSNSMDYIRLNQELRAIMHLITRDLRRAGYSANATSQVGVGGAAYANPFATVNTATPGCVLFSYDFNKNGTADTDEQFGYLFDAAAVKMQSGHTANSCAASADWEALNDVDITEITNLTFAPAIQSIDLDGPGPRTSSIQVRTVTVNLTGRLKRDPAVTASISESIRIRNDRYVD
jgi:prepilin peptidase dependent protein B